MVWNRFVKIVNEARSYAEYHTQLLDLDNEDKGKTQEYLIKYYFLSRHMMYDVDKYVARVCDPLPDGILEKDWGTDGYIYHTDGSISLVQVKYRSDKDAAMNRSYLDNMALEAGPLMKKGTFKHMYLITDTDSHPDNLSEAEIDCYSIKFLLSSHLMNMDWEMIRAYVNSDGNSVITFTPPPLRPWQVDAISFCQDNEDDRKQIIAPCGAGKTRVTWEITEEFDRIIIIVPTLHLLSQTFEVFAKYSPEKNYILVGLMLIQRAMKPIEFLLR
jgi:predicted helicase